jgi:uncharacterized protein with ParB-like and HNH nuclease domain
MVKKKKLTAEELKEINLQRSFDELMEKLHLIPEPTYTFGIAQLVEIGHLKDVFVEEIKENGKIYLINFTSIDNNRGNPIRNENQRRYVSWLDIRKTVSNTDRLEKNSDIRLYYSQRNIQDLLSKSYHFGVNFDPEYQREYVWELEDKIKLIDSIFNNVDIGKFTFIRYDTETWRETKLSYEVLDGKQRIRAILDYFEDRFEYKGKKFSDLSNRDKWHFEDYPISIAEVNQMSNEEIMRYFLILNTAGKVMDENHLEKVRNKLKD